MEFVIGLLVGFMLGLLVAGFCAASGRADLKMELMMKEMGDEK